MHACMHCAVRKQSQQQQHAKQCAGQVYGGVKCILSRDLLIPPAISCYFFIFVFFLLNCDREYNEWMVFISERKTWSEEEFVSCSVASGKKNSSIIVGCLVGHQSEVDTGWECSVRGMRCWLHASRSKSNSCRNALIFCCVKIRFVVIIIVRNTIFFFVFWFCNCQRTPASRVAIVNSFIQPDQVIYRCAQLNDGKLKWFPHRLDGTFNCRRETALRLQRCSYTSIASWSNFIN